MKYSDHFAHQIKHFGLPNLNKEQFQKMMNIAFMEGMLVGLSESGRMETKDLTRRFRNNKTLNELTKRYPPEKLYEEMKRLSEKN